MFGRAQSSRSFQVSAAAAARRRWMLNKGAPWFKPQTRINRAAAGCAAATGASARFSEADLPVRSVGGGGRLPMAHGDTRTITSHSGPQLISASARPRCRG